MHPNQGFQILNGVRRHRSKVMYRAMGAPFAPMRMFRKLFG